VQGTLTLSLLNLTQILGQIIMGFLSDRTSFHIPMALSTLLTSVSVLLVWGFSKGVAPLLVFSMLYGLFAGGYSVLYCRFATSLTSDRATGLWLYSIFEFQRGVGNIVGGLVSGLLVSGDVDLGQYGVEKYRALVIFTGVAMFVSSLGAIGWFFQDDKGGEEGHDHEETLMKQIPEGGEYEEIVLSSRSAGVSPQIPPLVLKPFGSEYRLSIA
jgi:MFS family permease